MIRKYVPRTSRIHRLLGIEPGLAPAWIIARDSCTGWDLFVAIETAILIAAFLVGHSRGLAWGLLTVAAIVPVCCLHSPFEGVERRGRARRRRGDCPWCGRERFAEGRSCPCRDRPA